MLFCTGNHEDLPTIQVSFTSTTKNRFHDETASRFLPKNPICRVRWCQLTRLQHSFPENSVGSGLVAGAGLF